MLERSHQICICEWMDSHTCFFFYRILTPSPCEWRTALLFSFAINSNFSSLLLDIYSSGKCVNYYLKWRAGGGTMRKKTMGCIFQGNYNRMANVGKLEEKESERYSYCCPAEFWRVLNVRYMYTMYWNCPPASLPSLQPCPSIRSSFCPYLLHVVGACGNCFVIVTFCRAMRIIMLLIDRFRFPLTLWFDDGQVSQYHREHWALYIGRVFENHRMIVRSQSTAPRPSD